MAKQQYKVVTPLAVIRVANADNSLAYVYQGGIVPDHALESEVARFLEDKTIMPVAEADEFLGKVHGVDSTRLPEGSEAARAVSAVVPAATGEGNGGGEPTEVEQPAGNASQEVWADYAISQGMPEEEARAAGRDELREKYTA